MEIIRSSEEKRRRSVRRLTKKIITFAAVIAFLTFVNRQTSPDYWWVVWVIAGWGLAIALSTLFYLFDCEEEEKDNH